jgi:hypothetical protein
MPEDNDMYADQFQVHMGPFGATINFSLTQATPPPPGSPPQSERLATIRMSLEHLKSMAFILHRQIIAYESQSHMSVGLPPEVLRAMQVRQEDWEAFWQP